MTTWFNHLLKTHVHALKVKFPLPENFKDYDPEAIGSMFTMVGTVVKAWDDYLAEDLHLSALHTLLEFEGHTLITSPPVLSNGDIHFNSVDEFTKLQICAFMVPDYIGIERRIITQLVLRNCSVTMPIAQLRKTLARYTLRYIVPNILMGNLLLVTGRMTEQQWKQVYLGLASHVAEEIATFAIALENSADKLGPVCITSTPDAIRWKLALNIEMPLAHSVFPNASQ